MTAAFTGSTNSERSAGNNCSAMSDKISFVHKMLYMQSYW